MTINSAPASGGARVDADTRSRRGTRIPARAQIMAWLLLVLVLVLVAVILIVRHVLYTDAHARISASLEQEAQEFITYAQTGRDPRTGHQLTDPEMLLRAHLQRQYPDSDEALIGAWESPTGLRSVSQRQHGELNRYADERLLASIVAAPENHGTTATPAGPMRWLKVRAALPNGATAWFVIERYTAQTFADADRVLRFLVVVSAFGVVLAAALSWLVAGLILAPVRAVRQTAAEISEDDLTRRIPVSGRDDIAALADQFNAMLDRLEDAFRIQRQFVDDAGHELRTPITIVRGNLELLEQGVAEQDEVVRLCTDELDRMTRIVEDLLILAKADRPDFVEPRAMSLAELTSDIELKVRSLAPRRWVIEQLGEGDVVLDDQRITQAMVQIAQNAVQHTEQGATIRVGSSYVDGVATLWVTDTGPGVDQQEVESIFERFAHGRQRQGRGGAGLGLAIVKAIAEAHHGRVRVTSQLGAGATFAVEIPAETVPTGPAGGQTEASVTEPTQSPISPTRPRKGAS